MPLNPDEIGKLRPVLASAGWREVIVPALRTRAQQASRALALNTEERKAAGGQFAGYSTKDLRAVIREVEWMLVAFQNEVVAHEHNQRLDELQRDGKGQPAANP